MGYTKRKCDNCGKEYNTDNRNLKRGWGLCCSKRCAAKKREKSKPSYDKATVRHNNLKRAGLLPYYENSVDACYNNSDFDNSQWSGCEYGTHY